MADRLRGTPALRRDQGSLASTDPDGLGESGRRGSQIYIVNTTQGIKDDLLRDTIVYLTCLHESGHALGLAHTNQFADIMYYFGFGGDINEYFGRYRRLLSTRDD